MKIKPETPILELAKSRIGGLSLKMAQRLAAVVANYAGITDPEEARVEDLLNYFPARYEDRSNLIQIDQLFDGIDASLELYVRVAGAIRVGKHRGPRQPPLFIFEINAGDRERLRRPVVVMWFISGKNSKSIIEYYTERFQRGVRFIAHGKWEWDARRNTFVLKLQRPDLLEILPADADPDTYGLLAEADTTDRASVHAENGEDDEGEDSRREFSTVHTARNVPVYRKLGSFQTKRLREIIYDVIQNIDSSDIPEILPPSVIKKHSLIDRSKAITEIHFPPDNSRIAEYEMFRSPAQQRLIFEEFFLLSFALQLVRGERQKESKGAVIEIGDVVKNRIAKMLPFRLTNAQRRVVKEIFADMRSDSPMNRLIQGDVGSGKTIIAFIAMFAAVENGYQAALMAPTEILAEQHFKRAKEFFEPAGYTVGLLTGSLRAAAKRKLYSKIGDGEVQVVVGTHAMIQDAVEFDQLGLAVIDEQHRFGVLQRAALKGLGKDPDILVMTATPIPRSLAMTVYGDLDISIIDELPPGRTPVKTVVVGEDKRKGVYKGIERELKLGRQAYVVYPLVEESEKLDLRAATEMYEELRDKVFPRYSVGLLHGRMKADEKESIMKAFAAGEINVLVSTTVIEVGVDVPNASIMVIEHAERFGLSQLHQLRGRVGRGAEQSYCVLLTADKKTAIAKERLGIMEETNDGFKIAEKDLELRGEGEILGTRQSGIQIFKLANIVRDIELLIAARAEAERLLFRERNSNETRSLMERVRGDAKFRLAGIG